MIRVKPKVPIILGPTAVGKTTVGIHVARAMDAEVVSADSRQVFRGMDIGTAKPSMEERNGIPHHIIDIADPPENFTVADFQRVALETIAQIHERGRIALVVGGTGLYVRALVDNPSYQGQPPDPDLREVINNEIETRGAESLYEDLKKVDPVAASRVHPNNIPRLVRAIEVIRSTGRKFSDVLERDFNRPGESPYDWVLIGLTMERSLLYDRINERVLDMVESGWLDEVKGLLAGGCDGSVKPMKGLGYRDMVRVVKGEMSLDDAVAAIQRDTRRFAKRQMTFFRGIEDSYWINIGESVGVKEIADEVMGIIQKNGR